MKKLLYLSDLTYQEKRRNYCKEDIFITSRLKEHNGIQRFDACRTKSGQLLLVKLEDLNPYLSLLVLDEDTRERFMQDFVQALNRMMEET